MDLSKRLSIPSRHGKRSKLVRDAEATKARILEAALAHFSEKGLAGARVDEIAELANINKRMLYHYFGNKESLFKAVLEQMVQQKQEALQSSAKVITRDLSYWFKVHFKENKILRLMMWEALAYEAGESEIVHEEARRELFAKAKEQILLHQETQDCQLDADLILLSLMGFCTIPVLLPQLTELITNESCSSEEFCERYSTFLDQFGLSMELAMHSESIIEKFNAIPAEELNDPSLPDSVKAILDELKLMSEHESQIPK